MIHEFARCPICGRGALAINDLGPNFLIEPASENGRPCRHLTLATVAFETEPKCPAKTGVWRWTYGEGLVGPDGGGEELGHYLTGIACDSFLRRPELFPTVPYELVSVYASNRESAHHGWGYFPVLAGKKLLQGSINGWALYSQTPASLMRDIRKRLDLWKIPKRISG